MRKAEALVRQLRQTAESPDPGQIDSGADTMAELLKSREFPSQRASEFREATKLLQLQAHQRAVDMLLGQAEKRAHAGDEKGRNELLAKAKDHFAKAIRHGAQDDFRRGVERRVQAVLLTTKDGVDERTKEAARRKLAMQDTAAKPPDGIEHRRAVRYAEPVLKVLIDGVPYTTINWSIRGLLVEPYRPESNLAPGDRVRVELSCEGVEMSGRQPAKVIRVNPERRAMALAFPEISTVILGFLRDLKDAGLRPESER